MNRWEAVCAMLAQCSFEPRIETIPTVDAVDRVLAHPVCTKIAQPPCLTCKLDSIAVHWSDFEQGVPDVSAWERGAQWNFANTGVAMPDGFDTAIVVEHVVIDDQGQLVSIDAAPSKCGAGTIPEGARLKAGTEIIPAGKKLSPLLAASALSGNNCQVDVFAKPRVAFIPTGDELAPAGDDLPRTKNVESNSLLIKSKIEQWGGSPILFDIVPDDPAAIEEALRAAVNEADIVVLNAGSSKGSGDWSLEVLDRIGTVICHQTNHGPGHHSSYSLLDGTPVVGISGPPMGASFTTDFYLRPLMYSFLGLYVKPAFIKARLEGELSSHGHGGPKAPAHGEDRPSETLGDGSFFFVRRMRVVQDEAGQMIVFPTASAHPDALEADEANAYYMQPTGEGAESPQIGDVITIELCDNSLSIEDPVTIK